MYSEAVPQ